MHVFVTGATGWVGSAVVQELIDAGHQVTGLVRSAEKAAALAATGAKVLLATLDDLDDLRNAASAARSEEHTSELQSLMRTSYAVFCLKKKNTEALGRNHVGTTKRLTYNTHPLL